MKVIKQKFKPIISGIKDRSAHVRHSVTPERMRTACELVRTVLALLDQSTWS
ncbi:hypothetical protein [Streptomyces luteogriseus]|uniref:hypothetical protein n=1 Tax=Streptomyces luteogriseus TaxID=68233 RepID=UPI0037A52A74